MRSNSLGTAAAAVAKTVGDAVVGAPVTVTGLGVGGMTVVFRGVVIVGMVGDGVVVVVVVPAGELL
jgi:hypothetical protein